MKILMLSCNTGQGHNSAAKAVCEQFIKLGEECVVKDTLAYASEYYSKLICESYTKIVMHTPRAFGAGYKLCKSMPTVSKIKSVPYISNMLTTKKLYDDIIEGGFEAVVCTHVFAGQAVNDAALPRMCFQVMMNGAVTVLGHGYRSGPRTYGSFPPWFHSRTCGCFLLYACHVCSGQYRRNQLRRWRINDEPSGLHPPQNMRQGGSR